MSSSHVLFYHYTSEWGLRGIKACGYIRKSSDRNNHAWNGEGTYGTSLPPCHGKDTIATNNWKRCGIFYVQKGLVDWAIEVKIPRSEITVLHGDRDILMHSGPIYLSYYEWRTLKVPDTEQMHLSNARRTVAGEDGLENKSSHQSTKSSWTDVMMMGLAATAVVVGVYVKKKMKM